MKTYTLAQLAWVKAVGISEEHASALTAHSSFRAGDLIQVHWDYGAWLGDDLELYIDHILESYPEGWPHRK